MDGAEERLLKSALHPRWDGGIAYGHPRLLLHLLCGPHRVGHDNQPGQYRFRIRLTREMDNAIDHRPRLAHAGGSDNGDILAALKDEAVPFSLVDQDAHSLSFSNDVDP
jgi:hypothetical protein